ncbi:MAG: transposase, partial [Thermoplasmata archaeon]|nr:transposase [Thermoplasmata archaeon]
MGIRRARAGWDRAAPTPFVGIGQSNRPRRARRRLSSWPRRELHRQLLDKAEERGVPVLWVDPAYTSRSCPVCG